MCFRAFPFFDVMAMERYRLLDMIFLVMCIIIFEFKRVMAMEGYRLLDMIFFSYVHNLNVLWQWGDMTRNA